MAFIVEYLDQQLVFQRSQSLHIGLLGLDNLTSLGLHRESLQGGQGGWRGGTILIFCFDTKNKKNFWEYTHSWSPWRASSLRH